MGLHTQEAKGRLLYVLADGLLREQVEETTPGAKLRIIKDDAGNEKARKFELTYPGITGMVTDVVSYDGEYGTNINVAMKDENDNEFRLSLKASSMYGEDFLHKLPNIDRTKEISIKPYNFESDGRKMTGVSMSQDGVKLTNAFNYKEDDKWVTPVADYPVVDDKKKPKNSEAWVAFFTTRRLWLMEYLTEQGLIKEAAAPEADDDF